MSITLQSRSVLLAVLAHPDLMSPLLLEYFLRGEVFGRMREKGLIESPYFGTLSDLPLGSAPRLIEECLGEGWLERGDGFYPAVRLTQAGLEMLEVPATPESRELSQAESYRVYYRWRQRLARQLRKPPYRILTNSVLNALASIKPVSLEELLLVPGIGKRRALRYRDGLIEIGHELRATEVPMETSV